MLLVLWSVLDSDIGTAPSNRGYFRQRLYISVGLLLNTIIEKQSDTDRQSSSKKVCCCLYLLTDGASRRPAAN